MKGQEPLEETTGTLYFLFLLTSRTETLNCMEHNGPFDTVAKVLSVQRSSHRATKSSG
jgi:hypothetical protein